MAEKPSGKVFFEVPMVHKYTHNMPPKKQTTSAPKNPWLKVVKETMKKYPSLPFSEVLKTAKASYRKTSKKKRDTQ